MALAGGLPGGTALCWAEAMSWHRAGVFYSPDAVQEVLGSAKGRLFFPGDLCLLLCF